MQHMSNDPSLKSEADPVTLVSVAALLASDFREAKDPAELARRLAAKGYQAQSGYLFTAPHGKMICPLDRLQTGAVG